MNRGAKAICALLGAIVIAACGGGGGGGNPVGFLLAGRVLSIETGAAPNPLPTVKVAGQSVTVDANGQFELNVPSGTNGLIVDANSAWEDFTFSFSPVTADTDVGDLWIGPAKITLKGRVLSSATDQPIEAAKVKFSGRSGETGIDGVFQLAGVAYSSGNKTIFWGIPGKVEASDFFATEFVTSPNVAIAGVVDIGDVRMTPLDDIDPPPSPFNLWGRVTPADQAEGAVATLKQNGTTIRVFTVGTEQRYQFWVVPGTYTVELSKGSLSGSAVATITTPDEVVRRDITLQ